MVLEVTWKGTHTGLLQTPKGSVPGTGKPMEIRACIVSELAGDKARTRGITSIWSACSISSASSPELPLLGSGGLPIESGARHGRKRQSDEGGHGAEQVEPHRQQAEWRLADRVQQGDQRPT